MDAMIVSLFETFPTVALFGIIAVFLWTLGKGADILVEEAVSLSLKWRIPKAVIGATVVSLGTTMPEVAVSVLAAIGGNPDLALGNAIGSIIVDTGLIIGIAAMLGKLPVDENIINRQGKIQIAVVVMLSIVCLPFFTDGVSGNIPQWMGVLFLVLLGVYIYFSMQWSKASKDDISDMLHQESSPVYVQLLKLALGIVVVIGSSKILIPAVEIAAIRIGIPQAIIAATLVAFGTSLPELITAITAVRKGHGELAIGNIVGADILNVLFVIGSAVAVTPGGLDVPISFYKLQIPAMLLIVGLFRIFTKGKDRQIDKTEGIILFVFYMIYLVLNFTWLA
jgi:cation:H+ antiporter